MNTQENKLSKIMEAMANKELSQGCEVLANLCENNGLPKDDYNMDYFYISRNDSFEEIYGTVYITHNQMEYALYNVIGHPLMIGDILNWNESKDQSIVDFEYQERMILNFWKNKRLSIDEQTEGKKELINYIFSIL